MKNRGYMAENKVALLRLYRESTFSFCFRDYLYVSFSITLVRIDKAGKNL